MARLIIWLMWLIWLLVLCVLFSRRVLLTPQFAFVGCFIPQAAFAFLFVREWKLYFSNATLFALVGGVTLFCAVSVIYELAYLKLHSGSIAFANTKIQGNASAAKIYTGRGVLVGLLIFQIVTIILTIYYISINVSGGTFIDKVARINTLAKFSSEEDKVYLPFYLNQFRSFCSAGVYIIIYILMNEVILKYRRNRMLLGMNLLAGLVIVFLSGNRGPFIEMAVAAVVQGYIIWGKSIGWKRSIRIRTLLKLILGLCVVVWLLYQTLSLFGRNTALGIVDYIGEYLSAPLKNFDSFIREGNFGCEFNNTVTFYSLTNTLGRHFNMPELLHVNDLPFRMINGKSLGNVYTVFYPYLHDGGVKLYILLISLMAIISQASFIKAVYKKDNSDISLSVIIYSYIFQTIALSFFSDRFYSYVISIGMIKYLLSWWLLRVILSKKWSKRIRIKLM